MKKIIGIIIASLVFCNIGYAEITLIEDRIVEGKRASGFHVATICVDGHKFVVTVGDKARSLVQFYETVDHYNRVIGTALPAKC